MNFAMKHPSYEDFYLLGISMTTDGNFAVSSVYLHPNGSWRTNGDTWHFDSKPAAIKHCRTVMRTKKKRKGFKECSLLDIPEQGRQYIKNDVDSYITADEMLKLMEEARLEYYVEFECVVNLEDKFDEGVEYLALRDEQDEAFYNVYDRYGELCSCHESRFSRCEPTERALEVLRLEGKDDGYACPACKDSDYGCANCTS